MLRPATISLLLPCCVAILLLASGCHNRNNDDSIDDTPAYSGSRRTVELHTYGFGTVALDTNTSYGSTETDFKLKEGTDTIPAKVGTRFGLSYQMTNTTEDDLPFTKTWILPHPITDPETGDVVTEYEDNIMVKPGEMQHAIYRLQYASQIVKGWWQLRLKYKKHLMYSHRFLLR